MVECMLYMYKDLNSVQAAFIDTLDDITNEDKSPWRQILAWFEWTPASFYTHAIDRDVELVSAVICVRKHHL